MIRSYKARCLLIGLGLFNGAIAMAAPAPDDVEVATSMFAQEPEQLYTRWGLVLDNDALISSDKDRDYTGAVAVTLSGSPVADYRLSLDPALTWINSLLQVDGALESTRRHHIMQFGLMLFTPEIDSTGGVRPGDRPF